MSIGVVSGFTRSNDESAKNHAEYGEFSNPLAKSRTAWRPLWLIAKQENGRIKVCTLRSGSAVETLPIFSHEEEAEIFLWFGTPGTGWRARETTAGKLVSLLYGSCAGVGEVALDPLPLFDDDVMAGLVSLSWKDFVRNLMDEHEFRAPYQGLFESETRMGFKFSENFRRRRW